jgi:hypothetical protein
VEARGGGDPLSANPWVNFAKITYATTLPEVTIRSKVAVQHCDPTMASVHTVATICSNNELDLHCNNVSTMTWVHTVATMTSGYAGCLVRRKNWTHRQADMDGPIRRSSLTLQSEGVADHIWQIHFIH